MKPIGKKFKAFVLTLTEEQAAMFVLSVCAVVALLVVI